MNEQKLLFINIRHRKMRQHIQSKKFWKKCATGEKMEKWQGFEPRSEKSTHKYIDSDIGNKCDSQ